jgi:hypothetical protein
MRTGAFCTLSTAGIARRWNSSMCHVPYLINVGNINSKPARRGLSGLDG